MGLHWFYRARLVINHATRIPLLKRLARQICHSKVTRYYSPLTFNEFVYKLINTIIVDFLSDSRFLVSKIGEMHTFVWGGSLLLLCRIVCFLISLIVLKVVFCGLRNNGDGFWLNKFCLWLLPNFGLLLIWYSSILLLSLFSTLSRSTASSNSKAEVELTSYYQSRKGHICNLCKNIWLYANICIM